MSEFFQILIQSNTLNFLIVLALIIYLVKKLNVNEKIENIRNEVQSYVEESKCEKNEAEKSLIDIEEKIKQLPAEIEKIKISTQVSVNSIEEKLKADTENKKTDIRNNAERIIQLETKKFKSKLSDILSETSVEIARKNAENQLKANRELHNKYIENAINELDRILL